MFLIQNKIMSKNKVLSVTIEDPEIYSGMIMLVQKHNKLNLIMLWPKLLVLMKFDTLVLMKFDT